MTGQPQATQSDEAEGILERFVAELVADEYPQEQNAQDGSPSALRVVAVIVAGVIGLVIAVSLLNAQFSTDERQQTRAELVERVARGTAAVEDRQAAIGALSEKVDALQADVLTAAGGDAETANQIERLSAAAGAAALAGPGTTITIDDSPTATVGSLNRVLDRDLQDLVNALWRAGATGIAINGQRLTADSAIRAAGDAILVDYQPMTRPYTLSAVGTTDTTIRATGIPTLLSSLHSDYGLVSDLTSGDVALPAGDVRDRRFAVTGSTSSSAPPTQE